MLMSQNLDSLSVRTYDRNVLLVKGREGKIKSPYTVSTVGLPIKPCSLYLIQYQSLDIVFQGCLKYPYSVSIVGLPKKIVSYTLFNIRCWILCFAYVLGRQYEECRCIKPLSHYAGNLLATWWQTMVAGDCHHIFTTIIFYWIKFVQCIFYIEDIVNKYLLTYLLPSVANGRQYVSSRISASVNWALEMRYILANYHWIITHV